MSWDQIGKRWKQLKEKIRFRREGHADDDLRDELIAGMASSSDNSDDAQMMHSRAKDRYRQSEFSQHIGC